MQVVFETPRLVARRLQADDGEAMLAVYGDAEAMRWVGDGTPLTAGECERWLGVTADNDLSRGYGMFALLERESGRIVGFCGLVHPGGQAEAEIKYAFLRSAWGRGLASEAAQALLGYGASAHGLQEVIATVAPDNHASQRVLEKAGMARGALRQNDDGSQTQLFHWHAPDSEATMTIPPVSYADFDDPPQDLMQAVDDGLERYNRQAAPLFDVRPLGAFATDPGGRVIGGAAGRGCDVFYLTTLSFQAPGFYRKHGYSMLAEIRGYPEAIVKHLMHKVSPPR